MREKRIEYLENNPKDKQKMIENLKKYFVNNPEKHNMRNPEIRKKAGKSRSEYYTNNPEKHWSYGRTTYELTSPNGNIFIVSGGFTKWCKERGLNNSNIQRVALGMRKQHKGWTARILPSI